MPEFGENTFKDCSMKKTEIFLFSALFICFAALLIGCKDAPADLQSDLQDEKEYEYGVIGKKIADLPNSDKSEIEKLYGTYWISGTRNGFTRIDNSGLAVCSYVMSISYENILWHKKSDGNWLCSAYHKGDSAHKSKRVILLFKTEGGKISFMQNIAAMGKSKSGPFEEKRDAIYKHEGKDDEYYVYADDGKSPKIKLPNPL